MQHLGDGDWKAMSKRGIQKVPRCHLLELDGGSYEFEAADEPHWHFKEIYEMVIEIGKNLEKVIEIGKNLEMEGFVASVSEMLLDLDQVDEEDALHWHSKKLAIAFALLRMTPGM